MYRSSWLAQPLPVYGHFIIDVRTAAGDHLRLLRETKFDGAILCLSSTHVTTRWNPTPLVFLTTFSSLRKLQNGMQRTLTVDSTTCSKRKRIGATAMRFSRKVVTFFGRGIVLAGNLHGPGRIAIQCSVKIQSLFP